MTRPHSESALVATATILLATIVVGASQQASPSPPAGTPATIPASVVAAAEKIANDPQVLALIKDQSTDAAAKARWNQFLELVRIPSPPRQEHLKAAEIHRRLVNEWGFSPEEVMTRADGVIAARRRHRPGRSAFATALLFVEPMDKTGKWMWQRPPRVVGQSD